MNESFDTYRSNQDKLIVEKDVSPFKKFLTHLLITILVINKTI